MIINFYDTASPIKYYAVGIQGNNLADKLEFVIKRKTASGLDLAEYTPYIKLQNVKAAYYDKDTRVEKIVTDDEIRLIYRLRRKTTIYAAFDLQIQFEGGGTDTDITVWQTEAITITLSRTIPADVAIAQQHPAVIQDLTARVEKLENETTGLNSGARELADLIDDATHRTVTDAEKAAWNAKQDALTFDDAPTTDSVNPVKSGGIAAALAGKAGKDEIPDVSQFITRAVTDLVNYYTAAAIDNKLADLNAVISAIPKFAIAVVNSLPTSDISATTVYLLKTSTTETGNLFTEYIYVNNTWEALGTQTIDLSNYATKDYVTGAIANFLTADDVNTILSATLANYAKISDLVPYAKTADIAAIGKSGNLADAAQDATHRTVTDVEKAAWNAKQNALTVDTTPTVGSTNPVTSGGVATALAGKADANSVPHASTDLSDGADLVRGSDTVTINGGGV